MPIRAAVRQASGTAYSLKSQGIGACAIVGANKYQSLRSLAEFRIPDLVDRRRGHETDERIQFLDAPAVAHEALLPPRYERKPRRTRMHPPKPTSHPQLIGGLLALGLLTSIAFAIAASVASSVATAAPPPQCPTGKVLNVQTNTCVPVKPATAAAPAPAIKAPSPTNDPHTLAGCQALNGKFKNGGCWKTPNSSECTSKFGGVVKGDGSCWVKPTAELCKQVGGTYKNNVCKATVSMTSNQFIEISRSKGGSPRSHDEGKDCTVDSNPDNVPGIAPVTGQEACGAAGCKGSDCDQDNTQTVSSIQIYAAVEGALLVIAAALAVF